MFKLLNIQQAPMHVSGCHFSRREKFNYKLLLRTSFKAMPFCQTVAHLLSANMANKNDGLLVGSSAEMEGQLNINEA